MALPPLQAFQPHELRPSAHGSETKPVVITTAGPITAFTPINAPPSRPMFQTANRPATPALSTCSALSPLAHPPQRPALSQGDALSLSPLTLPPLPPFPSSQSPPVAPHTLVHAPTGPPLKPLDCCFYLRGREVGEEGREEEEEEEGRGGVMVPEMGILVDERGRGTTAKEIGCGGASGGEVRDIGGKESQIPVWATAGVRCERIDREKERERQAYEPVRLGLETESMARQQRWERKETGKAVRMGKARVLRMAKSLRMSMREELAMPSHSPWTTV